MNPSTEASPVANHVFLDFENVHKVDTSFLDGKTVTFTLLMGPTNKWLDADLVETLIKHASSVKTVKLASSGKNALDFALAYYLGRKALSDPLAYFHVVTHDKGYDPLIEHLRSTGVRIRRHDDCSTLTFSAIKKTAEVSNPKPVSSTPASKLKTPAPRASSDFETAVQAATSRLKAAKNRPRTKTRLLGFLKSTVGSQISPGQANQIFQRLVKEKSIEIDDKGRVTYL